MFGLNLFANIPSFCLLYFLYGLAFFFLGVSIAVKDMKGSELKLADSLWLLAGFGFSHGAHEWLELYLILQGQYISFFEILLVKLITVFVVVLSFIFLLQFGLSLVRPVNSNRTKWLRVLPVILFLVWIIYLWRYGFNMNIQFFEKADLLARNTFGFAGGFITAYGLIMYSYEVKNLSPPVSNKLFYAGIAFAFYGVFIGIFPSLSVMPYLTIRVEVLRSITAILIACFIIKALNIFDIETRKKLEEQLRRLAQSDKLASLGHLASGIAHEINNPLTNVSLNIQILKNKFENNTSDRETIQKLQAIERNLDRASAIAKELLQFSRKRESEFIPLNINDVITGSLTLLRFKLNDVKIDQNLSDMPDVMGDFGKLEQVFINILNNSVESMPNGGSISISTYHSNSEVKVEISDTGDGISEENLPRVFDPFFTTKEIGRGTGLGLSICHGIINQHNGSIEISSAIGKGTTVTVKLPVMENYEKDSHSR